MNCLHIIVNCLHSMKWCVAVKHDLCIIHFICMYKMRPEEMLSQQEDSEGDVDVECSARDG